jgi:hypothetical protein
MTFDWNPFANPNNAFAAFEEIGDEQVGKIVRIRTHDFGQGKGPVPLLDIERISDAQPVTIVVGTIDLMQKMSEISPVGDRLGSWWSRSPGVRAEGVREAQGRRASRRGATGPVRRHARRGALHPPPTFPTCRI